jgi:Fic family protein
MKMELTYDRLIEFKLCHTIEKEIVESKDNEIFFKFFSLLNDIESTDRFIKETPSFPGSTQKIIRDEMISAIGATLAIEGTTLSPDEIDESFKKADLKEMLGKAQLEAENSRKVYSFIRELVLTNGKDFVISEAVIKQIHNYFTQGMNYLSNTPGEYRGEFQVTFGSPRKPSLCQNRAQVEEAMNKYAEWLNSDQAGIIVGQTIPRAILSHYYLSEIHPFGDGNGRTARAVEALYLFKNGINTYCFWSLANFWAANKAEYLTHLGNVRATCNPVDFILWGMEGYKNELNRIKAKILKKVKQLMFMDYLNYLLRSKRDQEVKINQRIVDVLQLLKNTDEINFSKFMKSAHVQALYSPVSQATLYRDFSKMLTLRLINRKEKNGENYISINYDILDFVRYNI